MNKFSLKRHAAFVPFSPSSVLLFLFLSNLPGVYLGAEFTILNNCEFTVWPFISGRDNPASINGFPLRTGESSVFAAPSSWLGSFWGGTNCSRQFGFDGNLSCTTGGESAEKSPITVVEFGLNQHNNMDFYNVSLVYGYNLPVMVIPQVNNCSETGCVADVNKICPPELQINSTEGKVVGCWSACQMFKTNEYCCNSGSCGHTNYSRVFKEACPSAYSYANDGQTSTFTCRTGANYNITFCSSANTTRFLPSPRGTPPSPTSSQDTESSSKGTKRRTKIALLIAASTTMLLILGSALFILRKFKQGKREKNLHELLTLDGYTETHGLKSRGTNNRDLRLFTYESILSATNNFSMDSKLGEGGFGTVYKGRTSDGQDIAVKLLSKQSGQGLLEFKTELVLISKLQHVNLVKLHGFCIHEEDKMLIYDYMPNKSLDLFLCSPSMGKQLNWQQRFDIIEGIAQGLLYLHKYSRLKIIHRDLKPSNILLDENMNAKISDFGLARVFERNIDKANTNRPVGTFGYMAPEYGLQGIFSIKSDVYSFGVLVLEIISGRKNNGFHEIEGPLNLVEYAWELWRNYSTPELMDPTLRDSCVVEQLQKCIHIGLLCVENRAVDRPNIEDVILMLKSEKTGLPMPKNPSFIARHHVLEQGETSAKESSVNEISTLSETEGR